MRRLLLGVLAASVLLVSIILISPAVASDKADSTAHDFIAAHRGYSRTAPENTLPAFEQAFRAGAQAIELDMQTTKDGQVVIIHDGSVHRTTNGRGKVSELTLSQVEALDAGSRYSFLYKGTKVPTLAEVLIFMKNHPAMVMFSEIKHYRNRQDIAFMVEPIVQQGLQHRTVVTSFSRSDLHIVRSMSPTVGIGLLCRDKSSVRQAFHTVHGDPHARVLVRADVLLQWPELIKQAVAERLHLGAWTVNRDDQADELRKLGVHEFITDDPKLIIR